MTAKRWAPTRGEVIWINLTPQAGHEQAGHRPALVLSPKAYNQKTGLALMCPITNQAKGYPFEVVLPTGVGATGVVLADQLRSLDWRARGASRKGTVPVAVVNDVIAKAQTLLQ